ncbi:hypothetical protein [Microbulbifer taiwanensis]|uniref:Uncharacterized protein n=1 Tax=Microbulbifer taiwanensis TaxID=986746 RepID=A0ABW1YSX6_9GAMM|nr:hypothetical protein [Microbulbifer taiwanensis]
MIGYCSAEFDFHWYGAQDSVNYIIYLCAKEHIEKGYSISDESILDNDYSIPVAPGGKNWSKKLAKEQFFKDLLTEEKFGYILASIEYEYWMKIEAAKAQLTRSTITQSEYEKLAEEAKAEFEGT